MIRKDGTAIDVRINSAYLRTETEEHINTICIIDDITERKKAEETLRFSSIQWQTTFDAMNDSVSLINLEGKILRCNKAMIGFLEKPSNEIIGSFCWELVHGVSEPIEGCPIIRMKETLRRETKILPVGERWLEVTVDPYLDGDNKLKGAIHIISDITVRKLAEEKLKASLRDKEVLLREIHHRVRNNLQVISSLLDMSSMRTGNQQIIDLCKDAKAKIHTMALIHTHLYQSDKFSQIKMGDYIKNLFDYLSQVYSEKKRFITPIIKLSEVSLSIDQAMPCSIVLNEAISNVFKHAFKEGQKGTIEICLKKSANDVVSIRIKDNGIGFKEKVDMNRVNTLGLKLMRNLVHDQLKGKIRIEYDKGTGIIIEFKIFEKEKKHEEDNGSR